MSAAAGKAVTAASSSVARLSAAMVVAGAVRGMLSSQQPYDYKILLLQRSARLAAFASFHVFPGGTVDEEDGSSSWLPALRGYCTNMSTDTSLRLTAMRECFEECGILVNKKPGIGRPGKELQQQVFKQPALFREVMEKFSDTQECLRSLKPVARFITPSFETRRFDTTFYASSYLTDASAHHDGVEAVSMVWLTPAEALAACVSGQIRLMPPQWYIMELLAPHHRWADAHAALPLAEGALQPEFFDGPDGAAMVMPGDESYSQPAPAGHRHRIYLRGWDGSFLKPMQFELQRRLPQAPKL